MLIVVADQLALHANFLGWAVSVCVCCCITTNCGLLTSLPAAPSPTCLPQALPAGATPSQPRKWKPFRSILENDNNG